MSLFNLQSLTNCRRENLLRVKNAAKEISAMDAAKVAVLSEQGGIILFFLLHENNNIKWKQRCFFFWWATLPHFIPE